MFLELGQFVIFHKSDVTVIFFHSRPIFLNFKSIFTFILFFLQVAALSVALFRALNLTTRYVILLTQNSELCLSLPHHS